MSFLKINKNKNVKTLELKKDYHLKDFVPQIVFFPAVSRLFFKHIE